jgi:hypothetical protein
MGAGIFSDVQLPKDSMETPAVVAADTLMKFRRVKGYLLDVLISRVIKVV